MESSRAAYKSETCFTIHSVQLRLFWLCHDMCSFPVYEQKIIVCTDLESKPAIDVAIIFVPFVAPHSRDRVTEGRSSIQIHVVNTTMPICNTSTMLGYSLNCTELNTWSSQRPPHTLMHIHVHCL